MEKSPELKVHAESIHPAGTHAGCSSKDIDHTHFTWTITGTVNLELPRKESE